MFFVLIGGHAVVGERRLSVSERLACEKENKIKRRAVNPIYVYIYIYTYIYI